MMYTTGLHGGVCHRTSTPHKSGIKMKKKKKNQLLICILKTANNPNYKILIVLQFKYSTNNLRVKQQARSRYPDNKGPRGRESRAAVPFLKMFSGALRWVSKSTCSKYSLGRG